MDVTKLTDKELEATEQLLADFHVPTPLVQEELRPLFNFLENLWCDASDEIMKRRGKA